MKQKPERRIDGVDEFMVQRAVAEIMREMENNGWSQGEAELFPKYLASAIKQNSERLEGIKPFTVCEVTRKTL